MKKILWVIFVVGFLNGCAPSVENHRRTDPADAQQYSNIPSVLNAVLPIASVSPESGVNIYIDERKSPTLVVDSIKGNFELVALTGKKGQKYQIEIKSLCECMGFKKRIMAPVTFLVDANGNVINDKPVITGPEQFELGLPVYLKVVYSGSFDADGKHYVLVAADSARHGHTMGGTNANVAVVLPGSTSFISIPISFSAKSGGEVIVVMNVPE